MEQRKWLLRGQVIGEQSKEVGSNLEGVDMVRDEGRRVFGERYVVSAGSGGGYRHRHAFNGFSA